jgi:hypothetical protein
MSHLSYAFHLERPDIDDRRTLRETMALHGHQINKGLCGGSARASKDEIGKLAR